MDVGNLFVKWSRSRQAADSAASTRQKSKGARGIGVPAWAAGAITVTALGVQLTGTGLDLLVLVLICCAVVALERTIGDWSAELLGPTLASLVLAIAAGAVVWFLLARNGHVEHFYAAAGRSGYGTVFHSRSRPPDSAPAATDAQTAAHSDSPHATSGRSGGAAAGTVVAAPGPRASRAVSRDHSWSFFRTSPAASLIVRIETPEMGVTGKSISIRAYVSAGGQPIPDLPVSFTVDGRPAGSGVTDSRGIVSTAFAPRAPRTYQVQATVARSKEFRETSARSVLYVLPAISSLTPRFGVLIV